jgi:crotonobetainyl-CoA:carnitine CoA-transferase CaiB-like acyl-CoA transferase
LSLVDFGAGYVAALALLAGLHAARRDGVGMDCDTSLFDTALAMLSYPATWHLTAGYVPTRTARSAHPSLVPFQNFPTGDGWIVVACPKEKFWVRLVEALGRPELARDPRFDTYEARHRNHAELERIIDALLATRTAAEWIEVLVAAGVPCAPVNDVAAAMDDPQTAARGMVIETDHPRWGSVRQVASPVKVGRPRDSHRRAPSLDEDRESILRDVLGWDEERIRSHPARTGE